MPLTTDSLVSTKLRPSQARPKLVARSRLTAKLEREPSRKLTLISAPAGFGKTTLLVEWLRERAGGEGWVAWLSLDEGDNDPVRFMSYLVAALRRTEEEEIGEGVLVALRSPEPPRIEAMIAALVNEIAALPRELTLVLDDYHLIDSQSVHGVVSFLLEHLPDNVHLIVASRVDPPLQLARLRARNQMIHLDATHLSFTSEEASTFLNEVMGLELSVEDLATLEERTEGWIAGLQLAALSMQDRKDVSSFIKAFSGSYRDVLDYLDEERRWYRYHHLFAEFLRGRLMRVRPERTGELHLRASGWYEGNGHLSEAVGHALSASDHDLAARLIEEGVEGAVERGEGATALRWLEALPTEAKRLRPRLFV